MSDAFRELFDGALVRYHEQLVASPADLAAKVRFVTLYHLIHFAAMGADTDSIRTFALDGLTRRLDIIGVPLSTL